MPDHPKRPIEPAAGAERAIHDGVTHPRDVLAEVRQMRGHAVAVDTFYRFQTGPKSVVVPYGLFLEIADLLEAPLTQARTVMDAATTELEIYGHLLLLAFDQKAIQVLVKRHDEWYDPAGFKLDALLDIAAETGIRLRFGPHTMRVDQP